ncbi:uncharacterized protein LOC124162690 [Ischnura elegans]|uniref:uncharacterized protein LOC124162690 n=1 Tax=Ischnura elegans TaxID=197161 RepID=UPI001ED8B3AB|nr:uncharacterized protein LOC124162690 [Ischnura elegans]
MSASTEKLIESVKIHSILFDLAHQAYKNIRKKDQVWEGIGRSLGSSGDDLKRRWKNLRDSYAKHLLSEKTHTGQQCKGINRYRVWPWANQMQFLRQYLQFSPTESNLTVLEAEDVEKESPIEDGALAETLIRDSDETEVSSAQKVEETMTRKNTPTLKRKY